MPATAVTFVADTLQEIDGPGVDQVRDDLAFRFTSPGPHRSPSQGRFRGMARNGNVRRCGLIFIIPRAP